MKKRIIAVLMASLMAFGLVGCGGSDSGKGGDTVDLTMWCIATESDSNRHSYEASIEDFKKAHPEINFSWEAIENQAYKTKIKAAVSANEMPDIFFTWSCAFLGDFVSAGRVYCVDEVYKEHKDSLPEVMMGNVKYDGKYYGVPMTMNIVGMFSNMELLGQVGYTEVPATYDELIDCCDKLVAKGIIPFGCSGKETWCVTEYLESIIEKTAGATALNKIFAGTDSWKNDDVAKAVGIFQEMIEKQYFDPNGIALTNDEVKANFMAGKYAFYMNGTWNCADFDKAGLSDKIKVAEFPVIDSSKSQLGELIGGPSDTLAVAAGSKNAEVAAKSAFELAKGICKYGYLDGCGLPAWTPDYDTSSINPLTQSVSEICANASQYVLFGDTAMSADTANIYLDYVSKIYASQIDGQQFVDGLVKDIK
jgi:raffinose/stachyose/melibiose transport system substrate-binding protein